MSRNALVTGTSTGIGKACVERLAADGWTVFAGVRRPEDGEKLAANVGGDVRPVLLDVTDEAQVADAVAQVHEAVGAAGLHGLVNNAGVALGGPVEFTPMERWRRQFEVNVFGQIAVTRAVFDLVRAGRGRFVFVGSMAGRVANPGLGPYAASKHALEALAESLRHELARTPMHVSLIEPGNVKTPIWEKGKSVADEIEGELPEERRADYGRLIAASRAVIDEAEHRGVTPEHVAGVVMHALTSPRPRARYLVGTDAKLMGHVVTKLPDRVRDRLIDTVVARYARQGE